MSINNKIIPFTPESFAPGSLVSKFIHTLKELVLRQNLILSFELEPPNRVTEKLLQGGGRRREDGSIEAKKFGFDVNFMFIPLMPGFWVNTHQVQSRISFDLLRTNPKNNQYYEIMLSHSDTPIHYRSQAKIHKCLGIISPPGISQQIVFPKGQRSKFVSLFIETATLDSLLDLDQQPELKTILFEKTWTIATKEVNPVQDHFIQTVYDYQLPQHSKKLKLHAEVLKILHSLIQGIQESPDHLQLPRSSSIELAKQIKELILNNLAQPPKIDEIAHSLNSNQTQIQKTFTQVYKTSIYQYYLQKRMEEAKRLIESGDYTISEVGELLGYKNMGNFSKKFKEFYKHPPKHFKP